MLRAATYSGDAHTWSSTASLNSRPNWFPFTLDVLSVVSFKLAPVRWLLLCWVKTLTCADAHILTSNINTAKLKNTTYFRSCVIFIVSLPLTLDYASFDTTRLSWRLRARGIFRLGPIGVKFHWVNLTI